MRELVPTAGILVGLILGSGAYGVSRVFLPEQIAFAALIIGVCAGLAARISRAIGSPAQLRLIVFGSFVAALVGEYSALKVTQPLARWGTLSLQLTADTSWLVFSLAFLVLGIFLGARILVGGDPLSDLLKHTQALGAGAGTACPRCDSTQTVLQRRRKRPRVSGREADERLHLCCKACGHRFAAHEGSISPTHG